MSVQLSVLLFLQYYALVNGEHHSEYPHSKKSDSVEHFPEHSVEKNSSEFDKPFPQHLCWPYPCSWLRKVRSRVGEKYTQTLQEIMGPLIAESASGLNRALRTKDLSTRDEIRIMITLPVSSLIFEYRRKMFNLLTSVDRAARSARKKSKKRLRRSPRKAKARHDDSAEESDKAEPLEALPEAVETLDLKKPADVLKEALDKILNTKDFELSPVKDEEGD